MGFWNRDRDRETHGMFGYEGEGYLRGGSDRPRDLDDDGDYGAVNEFARGGAAEFMRGGGSFLGGERDHPRGDYARGDRHRPASRPEPRNDRPVSRSHYGSGDLGYDRGGSDRGRDLNFGGYGDFNRGDYARSLTSAGFVGGSLRETGNAMPPRESFRGRGPKGYQRSDERIHEDVCERLAMDHYVDASDIEVQVSGATVTLTGTVADRSAKRRAEDLVEAVTGVRDVQNNLRIA
ncbi:MAG TPA: BON domain-containing protein [Thermoanaerobaculia bacterium]|jgi:hypothetical protein